MLEQTFSGMIDMSDWEDRRAEDVRTAFLSRSLAALCIKMLAGVSDQTAAGTLVDGFDDSGIDALFFDQVNDSFYFVQSKWNNSGNKPISEGASSKFADGVRDILAGNLERFNAKIKAKENEILAALRASRVITIILITVHSAEPEIGLHGRRKIDDLVEELNVPSLPEQARSIHVNQEQVYRLITSFAKPAKIDLPITLSQFGFTERPFLSYYGRANLIEVAGWWRDHGQSICDRNIRHFFHRSDVNDALRETLVSNPDYFWYFNNGITIICDSVVKSLTGSPGTALGLFNCKGVSVVNGAQTVGVIGTSLPQGGVAPETVKSSAFEHSWVQVRIISLEKCPPGFDRQITQATNFQNAVVRRDFAAMDPVQHRLATDFSLDGRRYVYKSGEEDPHGDDGCSITEATQALGCAASIELAVQVKREISELWWKIDRPPYTDLFNEHLTSIRLWRAVRTLRTVDGELQKLRRSSAPRADMIAVHLNRALLHLVFRDPVVRQFGRDDLPEEHLIESARTAVNEIFPRAAGYIEQKHPYDYLASFCKNREKCAAMVTALLKPGQVETIEAQLSFLPEMTRGDR
ncbi:AIPR family protein [Bradyrhizobium yuanmingense]|uniref:AIPR family protein n=1 Tax=Bradyrhizobium yuanmingense TaxID=108015 RepID=UPI0035169D15